MSRRAASARDRCLLKESGGGSAKVARVGGAAGWMSIGGRNGGARSAALECDPPLPWPLPPVFTPELLNVTEKLVPVALSRADVWSFKAPDLVAMFIWKLSK